MFVLNPDPYSLPSYRIGPFQTADVGFNHLLPDDLSAEEYLSERFAGKQLAITINGRKGINLALGSYGLRKNDVVTILTTSQNFYISSCVTNEIEKFCRWNREITPETKVILVNHEFGYPYKNMEQLMELGIPVIEDCCTTFFSQDDQGRVGSCGDFAVYSFPKFFPLQTGGLLVNNREAELIISEMLEEGTKRYILKVLSFYLKREDHLLVKRKAIFDEAVAQFAKMGFTERFRNTADIIPSALMLNNHGIVKDLPGLKSFLWEHGIQASVFYGEDAFFIPSHQRLESEDVNYFQTVISHFMAKQGK